ncbi:MAG: class I SAM-dependent methyltransferase [Treponema sp.]|nr:class I SAM-dependent methyltransferase [Treponema sp.]
MNNFFSGFHKPEGFGGWLLLTGMNIGHSAVSNWGLKHLALRPQDTILDIGCGGGKNIQRMLKRAPEGRVCGLDYAGASVKKSRKLNAKAIREGRCEIRQGSVSENPWPDNTFDIVTAFETIYFWPDLAGDFLEVRRTLKPGGVFLICNEMNKPEQGEVPYQYWINKLSLKTYTAPEFHGYLAEAGFIHVQIWSEGKNRLCISARAKKD